MTGATTEIRGSIAVIRFSHPPVNSLAHLMRSAIMDELGAALADDSIAAVVLTGEGRAFCAGAEITEFNTSAIGASPTAHDIWAAIDASPKPVIGAVNGLAMGGGLEFAMTCHYRVAVADAQLALPEVKLGLLPGAGGTQRLPRAVGVEKALEMITAGEPARAEKFLGTSLVDRVARSAQELIDEAVAFAHELIGRRPLRRLRDVELRVEAPEAYFSEARRQVAKRFPGYVAPPKIVDCIEAAATLPFDEGIRVERAKFQEVVNGEQSKAMRRAFFGERRVARIDAFPDVAKLIGERLFARYREEGLWLRAEGVAPERVDRALEAWGMARGPFAGAVPEATAASSQSMLPDEEIVERCILAMVNDAALMLEVGLVDSAVEIDVACLRECGFPRFRGGPLFYANTLGLDEVVRALSRHASKSGDDAWTPSRLLAKMAQIGVLFD